MEGMLANSGAGLEGGGEGTHSKVPSGAQCPELAAERRFLPPGSAALGDRPARLL